MERYMLFRYFSCYPSGGMKDLKGFYKTIDEAKSAIAKADLETLYIHSDIIEGHYKGDAHAYLLAHYKSHIYDVLEVKIVWDSSSDEI